MQTQNKRIIRCREILLILEGCKHKNGTYFTQAKKITDKLNDFDNTKMTMDDGRVWMRNKYSGHFDDWTCWDKTKNEKYFKLYVRHQNGGMETKEQFVTDMNRPVESMIESFKHFLEYEKNLDKEAFSKKGIKEKEEEVRNMLIDVIDRRVLKVKEYVAEAPKYQIELDMLAKYKTLIVKA